jgi:CRP-like cAMP-binding protein
VLSGERFSDSAVTLEDSTIAFIPREAFLSVLEQSKVLNSRLLQLLGHEFTVFVNNLTLFAQRSIRERFALQLILLREKYKPAPPGQSHTTKNSGSDHLTTPVEINLSREDLANLVGARRENIVRTLAEFKQQGILITRGRKIIVRDVIKLIQIANFK